MGRNTRFVFLALVFFFATITEIGAKRTAVPAIFVFGDSTVDVGNNNFLPGDQSKANFPHNGIDFPGGTPTGRFSNGYNGVDYLAKKLRFRMSPQAYLSITQDASLYHGVNFASGGSGILDATSRNLSISLNAQIDDYRKISTRMKNRHGTEAANRFLAESLFVFSTGNNDLLGYFARTGLQNATEQELFIGLLGSQFQAQLQTLYSLGARKFVVFGSSKLGCVPILRRNVPTSGCIEEMNELSQKFNGANLAVLRSLSSSLTDFSYSFINVYDVVTAIEANPQRYGFTILDSACCGSGRLNADAGCRQNSTYCGERDQFFFWDRLHPTQAASRLIARAAYNGRKYTTPITVRKLAIA
ncbi:GDSL esterase/lipase At5g55050-like [Wolffia australiana]